MLNRAIDALIHCERWFRDYAHDLQEQGELVWARVAEARAEYCNRKIKEIEQSLDDGK